VVDLAERQVDPVIGKMLPKELEKEKMVVPFAHENGALLLAMQDPRDIETLKEVEIRLGIKVIPYVSLPSDIWNALSKIYGEEEFKLNCFKIKQEDQQQVRIPKPEFESCSKDLMLNLLSGTNAESSLDELELGKKDEIEDIAQVDITAPEIEKICNLIILEAIRLNASDIHIEPFEKRLSIRHRVDGELQESAFQVPFAFKNALISKIKILGGMNIAERRIPQDGRISLKAKGKPYEFRVNVVPSVMGESAVLRILDRSGANLSLGQLGFLPEIQRKFVESLMKPYGFILVCGPTGSGKSFTLMAALSAARNPKEKILTAENPVEYNLEGVVQVQVNPDLSLGNGKKFDFAVALRSFLRQDPDTIMVGEIRDLETARVSCEAAMTGHLVLSTIHTNDATSVIGRLSEMGVAPYLIASTLECILAQRLVRTLCIDCKKIDPNPNPELLRLLEDLKIDTEGAAFMKPGGCSKCRNAGMKGRTAIHELLVMNDESRAFCKPGFKNDEMRSAARKMGMRTLLEDGLIKVTKGITTFEEIMAAAK
jgi:type II secretory ATPase GspE/PulE/Tfp pilus assembly ATPase PilB-like protein